MFIERIKKKQLQMFDFQNKQNRCFQIVNLFPARFVFHFLHFNDFFKPKTSKNNLHLNKAL